MRSFALSISDALDEGAFIERLSRLTAVAAEHPNMRGILVKGDSGSIEGLTRAVDTVAGSWDRDIMIETRDCASLLITMGNMESERTWLCHTDLSNQCGLRTIADMGGGHAIVRGRTVQEIAYNLETVGSERTSVMLDCQDMQGVLESFTTLERLVRIHGMDGLDGTSFLRVSSGEFAIALATVAYSRGCDYVLFDDLNMDGCDIVNTLCSNQQPAIF